jgi:hypothetical protein
MTSAKLTPTQQRSLMDYRNPLDISIYEEHTTCVAQRMRRTGRGGARPGAGRKRIVQEPERIAVDLEKPDLDALRTLGKRRGTSVADLIRRAVSQYLHRAREK